MAKTIENLSRVLHWGSNGLVILLFLLFIAKTRKEKGLWLILIYSLSDSLLNFLGLHVGGRLHLSLGALATFIEYSAFAAFIYFNIKRARFKKIILYTSIIFIVFSSVYDIVTNFQFVDSIPIGIETLLILLFSFYYLYEQANDTSSLFIYSKYQFWVVIGMLIYLAGSFFIYIFASQLSENLLRQYWNLTNVFYTLMNLFFVIAIIIFNRNSRISDPYAGKIHPYLN